LKIFIALLHYPVYNREREIISTQITNLDFHDISRAAKTYGVDKYYVATPFKSQQELAKKIIGHWTEGYGAEYNEFRKEALINTSIVSGLDDILTEIESEYGVEPKLIATAAKGRSRQIDFLTMRKNLEDNDEPHLLLFGTGWGLADELIIKSDYVLEPIKGDSNYNHLSVRSAVAIVLDRLFGLRQ
jgi:hypothetical protein